MNNSRDESPNISSFNPDDLSSGDWDDEIFEDDEAALRWRHALLRLSETFLDAAEKRSDLSPILLGALHNALEQLLIHGEEADLMALEDWLGLEAPPGDGATSTPRVDKRASPSSLRSGNNVYRGIERRSGIRRRSGSERRQSDRSASDNVL